MALLPLDQVFDWAERSRQSLHDDIVNMHRNLFSLEVSCSGADVC